MRDDAVFDAARFARTGGFRRSRCVSIIDCDWTNPPANAPAGDALRGYSTRRGAASLTPAIPEAFRKRALPGPVAPAGRARLPRCKTQYKCGNSRLRNNHPLGKPGYDQPLLLAPALLLSLEWKGCWNRPFEWRSNACSFRSRWIHEDPGHPRDGAAAAGSVPNRGPEGM